MFVGRLVLEKGILLLLEALIESNIQNKWKLNIVGEGPLKEKLKLLIKEYNLEDNIQFWGYLSQERLAILYRESDIYVSPSFSEGFGLTVAEASACGITCLTSDLPSFSEILENYPAWIKFKNKDKEDLKRKLINVLLTYDELNQYKVQSSKYIIKKYSWKNIASIYSNLYRKFANEG